MSIYSCDGETLLKNSRIPIRVLKDTEAINEEIAEIMLQTIVNAGDKDIAIICPVGPIGQYPLLAEKINRQKVSLRHVWFFNMDEYLDENMRVIDPHSPLSFHRSMEENFYTRVEPSLLMPPEQRLFPVPGEEARYDALLERMGGAALSLTGVGINGHIAFNEPPEPQEDITDEAYRNLGTRCLPISRETIVNNGGKKIGGALDIFPKHCITVGMKQLLQTKVLKVYLYCDWQWGIIRKAALQPPTRFAPVSFLQEHPNSEMVITEALLQQRYIEED